MKLNACFTVLLLTIMSLVMGTHGLVGCNVCNSLQVKCLTKSVVMSCSTYPSKPHMVTCRSGTYCNVNMIPWCSKDNKPLCKF